MMIETEWFWRLVSTAFFGGFVSIMWFFVRGYFKKLSKDLETQGKGIQAMALTVTGLQKDLSHMAGGFDVMRDDVRKSTEETIKHQMELKALWRYHEERRNNGG